MHITTNRGVIVLRLAIILSILIVPLYAQYTTATLSGVVRDPSGAVVPDADITVVNTETGLSQTTRSNSAGAYLFPRLPVGSYELRVRKPAFMTYVQSGITLTVNQEATQDVVLRVGEVTESVTVVSEAEAINTRTATAEENIGRREVVTLPLEGRRPERLIYLAAGSVDLGRNSCRICGHGGVYPGEETAGVNGAGISEVNFQMDAISHNDTYLNASLPFPNPDAIQEFTLQSTQFTAEYGTGSGGQVNIVTKSGTNEIHGSLFEFLRNGDLNSREFFAAENDGLKRNQFGGSVGGPIVKNKLFYFANVQITEVRFTEQGRVSFVPTAEEREGDFSAVSTQIVDPLSGEPLSNNQIPASRISPVSKFFLDNIPLPNGPNRRLTFPGTKFVQDEDQFLIKGDFTEGNHSISGSYFFTDFDSPPEIPQGNVLASTSAGNAVRVQAVSLSHTYIASPTFLFTTSFGINLQRGGSLSGAPFSFSDAGVNILGPEDTSLNAPPELVLTVTDGFRIRTNHLGDFDRDDLSIRHVVTKIVGNHELKFGGEAIRTQNNIINTFQMAGQITFNGQLSNFGLSDFMFGRVSDFRQGGGEFKDQDGIRWGFFVQDNWRVTPKLSLNLGLRWDPYLPPKDADGRAACWMPGTGLRSERFPNAPEGMLFGGDPGCPEAGLEDNWNNYGPRVGFAYRVTGSTVVRGGAGIYYTPLQTSEFNPFSNIAPFAGTFTLRDVDFADPYGSAGLDNPFPANFGDTLPGSDFVFAPRNDIRRFFSLDFRIPQLQTWSLRVERQMATDWVASVAYVGNKGSRQRLTTEANPGIFIPGVDEQGNPLSTVGNTQARRRYPDAFGRVRRFDSGGNSFYHGLQLNLEKRFSHGYSLLTNYTWSRNIDDIASGTSTSPFDRTIDRGLSDGDVEHNFKFSNVWAVPGVDVTGAAGKILNGWELNSIVIWQSGLPFTAFSGRDNSFTGIGADHADFLGGDADLSGRSRGAELLEFFDTSKFIVNQPGTFGNAGRNILRGPAFFKTDFSVIKNTPITERVDLQFRAEFFNLFNNANFRFPNANASSAQFGQITSTVDESQRIIQFGLKLLF